MDQVQESSTRNLWDATIFAGSIIAVLIFSLSTITGYVQINSQPDGSVLQPSFTGSFLVCLLGAFAGMLSVWYYSRYVEPQLTLGRGALLGVLAGLVVIIIENILATAWSLIDPDYTKQLMESIIASIEAMEIPENLKQQQIDMIGQQYQKVHSFSGFFKQILFGFPLYGLLNVVTAMIGVKVFGSEKEV
jgi:H+/Cl- antiporter ClcA